MKEEKGQLQYDSELLEQRAQYFLIALFNSNSFGFNNQPIVKNEN